jgi:hypothetical protein
VTNNDDTRLRPRDANSDEKLPRCYQAWLVEQTRRGTAPLLADRSLAAATRVHRAHPRPQRVGALTIPEIPMSTGPRTARRGTGR